jgi:hypothetical protein
LEFSIVVRVAERNHPTVDDVFLSFNSTKTGVTSGTGAVYPCGAFFSRLAIALSVLPRFTTSDYAIGLINNNKIV